MQDLRSDTRLESAPDAVQVLEASTRRGVELLGATALAQDDVHRARKALKRARATLRLLRGGLGRRRWQRENAALRDAGRLLAPARDAAVQIETFERLCERHAGVLPAPALVPLRAALQAQLREAAASLQADTTAVAEARGLVQAHRDRMMRRPPPALGAHAQRKAFRRLYRAARRASKALDGDPMDEALHEWRKRTQLLVHALQGSGASAGPVVSGLQLLAQRLGEHQDLALLVRRLQSMSGVVDDPVALDALLQLAQARKHKLARRARRLGRALFAQKPRAFVRRQAHVDDEPTPAASASPTPAPWRSAAPSADHLRH